MPKYIPAKDEKPFLLFADVFNEDIDAYRGVPIKTTEGLSTSRKC